MSAASAASPAFSSHERSGFPYRSALGSGLKRKKQPPEKVQKASKIPVKSSDFTGILQ